LHWILAGVWANYRPGEFLELDGEFQSLVVAAYETNQQVEAVVADEHLRDMKRRTKKR